MIIILMVILKIIETKLMVYHTQWITMMIIVRKYYADNRGTIIEYNIDGTIAKMVKSKK